MSTEKNEQESKRWLRTAEDDLFCLRESKGVEKDAPTIGIEELKKRIKGKTIYSVRRTK